MLNPYFLATYSSRLGLLARSSQERRCPWRYPGHPPVAVGLLGRLSHFVLCPGRADRHTLLPALQERFASRAEDSGWPSFQVSAPPAFFPEQ